MKIRLLIAFLTVGALPVLINAQNLTRNTAVRIQPTPHPAGVLSGTTNTDDQASARTSQVEIGTTTYDIASYGSTGHRIYRDADNNIYAAWHFSTDAAGGDDRGTAVNTSDGTEWGDQERVEGELRGGFPAYAVNEAGDEFVTSHINVTGFKMGLHTRLSDETEWTTTEIPSAQGMVWGKIAVSGDNGEILHVVGLTLAADFGGAEYEGLVQHPLYYRSADKGQTWEVQDFILPGVDSTKYLTMDAEAYTIEAKGDVVAIGFFPAWGDAVVLKSTDGGDTWENNMVLNHPLDKYDDSFAYTAEDTNTDPDDADVPDSLAILSSDSHASLIIDNDDIVHAVFGKMYYSADGAGGRFYFPFTDGLFHWKESEGVTLQEIARAQDFNTDDTLSYSTDFAVYQRSLTGMPSMGIDADGHLFTAYSEMHELYLDEQDNQNFRHVFIIKSEDNGDTWTEPFAVINGDTFEESFVPVVEGVFPQIPHRIGENIDLIYEQDFRAGLASWGDEDAPDGTAIVYVNLDKDDFGVVSTVINRGVNLRASVTPNLTTGAITLEFFPVETTDITYEVINTAGEIMLYGEAERITDYLNREIDLSNLTAGMYWVRLQTDKGTKTFKVVKQ